MADREWKENVAFWEKGNRILHFKLSDLAGNSLLAVVAIEKKERHMAYSVSAEYLRAFGSTSLINAETKWTSRKGVEKWLDSLVESKDPIFPIASQGVIGKIPSMAHCDNHVDAEGSKISAYEKSEITWSGDAWVCNKHLKHYPSFCRRGIDIAVYSFVYVMVENEREDIAYVQDLYEDQNLNKMVRVKWFNFLEDVEDLIMDMETHAKEVFMTSDCRDISAECVNGVATVLTPIHFNKCLKFIPELMSSETFMCHREVKNSKIKPAYLSELHGYSSQAILSCLMSNVQYIAQREGCFKPKLVQRPQHCLEFNENDNVEILSQDSGLRGCWFRYKILCVSQKSLVVRHYDVKDLDAQEYIEERVQSHRVANQDKLGMRHAGRLTVRPIPSENKSDSTEYCVGSAIDAWWCDGWWEGVVIGLETSSPTSLQLFLPGEQLSLTIDRKFVRTSKDWINGDWANIDPNPNILSSVKDLKGNKFAPLTTLPPAPLV